MIAEPAERNGQVLKENTIQYLLLRLNRENKNGMKSLFVPASLDIVRLASNRKVALNSKICVRHMAFRLTFA